ncbi:hypothetical protein KEM52_002569, partial [Ascosphaera acerosa]
HADAFNGLLSLIPAKYYYGEDNSDQWQRKKQTKEQAKLAKRAKLDPDSQKTAKDVMDENARKRKREERDGDGEGERSDGGSDDDGDHDGAAEGGPADDDDDTSEIFAPGHEQPREGLNRGLAKKQKREGPNGVENDKSQQNQQQQQQQKELEERRKARAERKNAKKEQRKKKLAEKLEKKRAAEQERKGRDGAAAQQQAGKGTDKGQ